MPAKISGKHPLADQPTVRKVLVIEDTSEFAKNALALENCEVTLVGNLKAAIQLMRRQKFDMVLSDLTFPTREGEAPKRQDLAIANHCLWNNLPLAIVTRGDPASERHDGNAFISTHTFTPDDLVRCLAEHGLFIRLIKNSNPSELKFNILRPGNDVYFTMKDCTMKREKLISQTEKSPQIWKNALRMLETSISERGQKGKDRTFSEDAKKGWHIFVRQGGRYLGIPNAVKPKIRL